MKTHLRARGLQAGAFLVLVTGLLAVAAAPAMAADPSIKIDSLATDLQSGATTDLQYTVTSSDGGGTQSSADIGFSDPGTIKCSGDCGGIITIPGGQSVTRKAKITVPLVDNGQSKTFTLTITVNGNPGVSVKLNVKGSDKPATVRQVSGKVKGTDGKAIAGAIVQMKDNTNRSFTATTNADGGYAFTSTDQAPIAVGALYLGAAKDGFKTVTVNVQGAADKSINVPLTLPANPAATPASAAPSIDVSEDPTTDATEDTPTDTPTTNQAQAPASDSGGSSSLLFIVMGGLLVAAGIGAIVLVIMRRKDNGGGNDDPDDPDGPGPSRSGGAVPNSRGSFSDRTRVGGGPSNDQTMVANLSEAPTMLHRPVPPVEDEYPDPYGAPAATPGRFNGPGGWGTTAAAAPQYGGGYQQNEEQAYGAYAGNQYEQPQQRYDEQTGMYRPEGQYGAGYQQQQNAPGSGSGYGGYSADQGGGYGAQQGGGAGYGGGQQQYGGDQGGYGQQQGGGGGYGGQQSGYGGQQQGGGYGADQGGQYGGGQQQGGGGGYGGGQQGGGYGGDQYGGGYDQGGGGNYGNPQAGRAPGQYGQPNIPQQGGSPDGYYSGQQQPRGQQPPQESTHPGQRRSLDWLDD